MGKYTLESKSFAALTGVHQGTGNFAASAHVVDPQSVNQDVKAQLKFKFAPYKITVMSVEIATSEAPNWFGVSFRQGINAYNTVNIFCHPYPQRAGMRDEDYQSKSGSWPKLFRYAEIFGRQMSIAQTDHITIVPFFTNKTYDSSGIFGPNWKDIVEQILALVRNAAVVPPTPTGKAHPGYSPVEPYSGSSATHKKGSPAPAVDMSGRLQHVVLSDFSHGRKLMWTVRQNSPGIDRFLREVWDFDGVHATAPSGMRGFYYYDLGGGGSGPNNYPVPPERWLEYHKRVLSREDLHGDVPAMLACHAATISRTS